VTAPQKLPWRTLEKLGRKQVNSRRSSALAKRPNAKQEKQIRHHLRP
jgi:hypothetical protein